MFKFKTVREMMTEERRKTAMLQATVEKATADIEYIAMMTDVELDETEETDDGNE